MQEEIIFGNLELYRYLMKTKNNKYAAFIFSATSTTWISGLKMHHLSSNAKHIDSLRSSLLISRGLTGTEQLRTVEWHHRQILLCSP